MRSKGSTCALAFMQQHIVATIRQSAEIRDLIRFTTQNYFLFFTFCSIVTYFYKNSTFVVTAFMEFNYYKAGDKHFLLCVLASCLFVGMIAQ
jgi:hypothetical protein